MIRKEMTAVRYKPTKFKLPTSHYDKAQADYVVSFIQCLKHTKGRWAGQPFHLLPWQEQIVRDVFGILKPNGKRQFNTAYIEIPKKNGKSELAAAIALFLLFGDGEPSAEVYGAAADRQQASIVFDVANQMLQMNPDGTQNSDGNQTTDTGNSNGNQTADAGNADGNQTTEAGTDN